MLSRRDFIDYSRTMPCSFCKFTGACKKAIITEEIYESCIIGCYLSRKVMFEYEFFLLALFPFQDDNRIAFDQDPFTLTLHTRCNVVLHDAVELATWVLFNAFPMMLVLPKLPSNPHSVALEAGSRCAMMGYMDFMPFDGGVRV